MKLIVNYSTDLLKSQLVSSQTGIYNINLSISSFNVEIRTNDAN